MASSLPGLTDAELAILLAEMARPLTHEFNNLLNSLLLQLTVWETGPSPDFLAEIGSIRKQANFLANLTQQWQGHLPSASSPEPVDLHKMLHKLGDAMGWNQVDPNPVVLDFQAEDPLIIWPRFMLQVLLTLVPATLIEARARRGTSGLPCIATRSSAGGVELTFVEGGPGIITKGGAPFSFQEAADLRLLTCHLLCRRHGRELKARPNQAGGLTFSLELPRAVS